MTFTVEAGARIDKGQDMLEDIRTTRVSQFPQMQVLEEILANCIVMLELGGHLAAALAQ